MFGEIRIDQRNQALPAEARVMAGMHDVDGHCPQAAHRLDVCRTVAFIQRVNEWAIINGVPREEGLRLCFPKPDAAPRVAGKMDHFKSSIAQVDHISFINRAGGGPGLI